MKKLSTKEKILLSAKKVFIEHGFAGAAISKIATLAEVNHSLIFHHFKNKESLWLAVKQHIVKEANQQSQTLPDVHLAFKDFLHELLTKNINFYRRNPDIVRMINWQRLEHQISKKIGITLSNEMQRWIDAFKTYQQKGEIKPSLKIEFIITLVLSIVSSAALDQNVFISNEKAKQAYIDFCVASLLSALTGKIPRRTRMSTIMLA